MEEEQAHIRTGYSVKLICEEKKDPSLVKSRSETGKKQIELKAEVIEDRNFQNYHETVDYEIVSSEGIGFDHAKIIVCAFLALQNVTRDEDGITIMSIYDFLLKENSLEL